MPKKSDRWTEKLSAHNAPYEAAILTKLVLHTDYYYSQADEITCVKYENNKLL